MNSKWNVLNRSQAARLCVRGLAACALLLLGTGCAPTTVNIEAKPNVSVAEAKRDLGIDYLSSGRTAMAIRELLTSLELDAKDPKTHLWLGEAFRRKGQTEVAEKYLLDAIDYAKRRTDNRTLQNARLNLSALLSQMGRYEDSIEQCEELAADPTLSTPWRPLTNCGWAMMRLGRLEEARDRFESALDYYPGFGPALLNLGVLEAKQGHRMAAIKRFQKALDSRLSTSAKSEVNYRLGEIYIALGKRDYAMKHFRAAADATPDLDWGTQSQAYLDLLR